MKHSLLRSRAVLCALCSWGLLTGNIRFALANGNAMDASQLQRQQLLLNPLFARESVSVPNRNAVFATAQSYPGVTSKLGLQALKLQDVAPHANHKAEFLIATPPPNQLEKLDLWVYLTADSNVAQLGLCVADEEGKILSRLVPADWEGWKLIETDLAGGRFKSPLQQSAMNGQVNARLKAISFIWLAKGAGPTSVGISGLSAIARGWPSPQPFSLEPICPTEGDPALPFPGQLLVHNFSANPVHFRATYSIQRNPQLCDKPLVDPALGHNRALSQKSWVELDGARIEDSTLTDGDDQTDYGSPWINNHYREAFQFVDLGQERKIIRMDYQNGDATWIHQVDIAVSANGIDYAPVDGLQNLDLHHKWGLQTFPVKHPFAARYIRLRYHDDAQAKAAPVIRTLAELYVYDGPHTDYIGIPKIGDAVEQKSMRFAVAPRSYALVAMGSSAPLPAGSYYFGIKAEGDFGTRLMAANHFVRSAEQVKMRPDSRFGINAATVKNVPLIKEMGFAWIRFENLKWGFFNTSPGEFLLNGTAARSDVPFDDYMQTYQNAGLSTLPYVFQTPAWASSAPKGITKNIGGYPPRDYEDYGKAIFELAARYGRTKHPAEELHTPDKRSGLGLVTDYEIWNEPNLDAPDWGFFVGPLEKYFDLFRVGAEAVKRADPHSRVCGPAFSGLLLRDVDKLRRYRYADGKHALDFTDILSVHFYSGRQEPELATDDPNTSRSGQRTLSSLTYEQELNELADWRDDLKPSLPIWLTETGNDVGGPIGRTERLQAAKLPRDFMIALANGVEKVFLYRETGSDPVMHGGAGVIRNNGSMRPSFFTLSTLSRQLDGVLDARTPRLITADPKVWLYRWKRGTNCVLTAWTPENTAPLGLDLGRCHVVDAFGFASELTVDKNFPLGIFPVYISQVANPAPIDKLVMEAKARQAEHKQLRAAMSTLHAYLYQFGSDKYLGLKLLGLPRPFTAVLASDVYDSNKGYGLGTSDGKNDEQRNWSASIFDKTSVDFDKPNTFQIDAAPGFYEVEFKATDTVEGAKLVIHGAQEGTITVPFVNRGQSPLKTQLTVLAGKPVIFSIPAGIKVQYVSMVESLAQTR